MKNLSIVLVALLGIMVASSAYAAFEVTVDNPGVPLGYGLVGYTVSATGLAGDIVVTFENFAAADPVHQVWDGILNTPTPFPATPSSLYDAGWVQYDSHLLIPPEAEDYALQIGSVTEGNDGTTTGLLPQGAALAPAVSGYGGLSLSTFTFALKPPQPTGIDLAYLVYPEGGLTYFTGTLYGQAAEPEPFEVLVGIPEPSTMILLGIGLVGLLAWRRR